MNRFRLVNLVFSVALILLAAGNLSAAISVETQVCSGIQERMPIDSMTTFPPDVEQVFLWCKVTGAEDSTSITLVWKWQDQEIARVELPVKSTSWRTWGSKKMWPTWIGQWNVDILDAQGDILKSVPFMIGEVPKPDSTDTQ